MRSVARATAALASAGIAVATAAVIGTGTAAAAAPAVPTAAASPCAPSATACFSVGQRRAWLTDGAGRVVYGPVPALGGTSADPTPKGTFAVTYKDADHVSNLVTPGDMPNSVFFTSAIAFHQGSLSQRSHGCVHLSRTASQRFFDTLRRGDEVQVVG